MKKKWPSEIFSPIGRRYFTNRFSAKMKILNKDNEQYVTNEIEIGVLACYADNINEQLKYKETYVSFISCVTMKDKFEDVIRNDMQCNFEFEFPIGCDDKYVEFNNESCSNATEHELIEFENDYHVSKVNEEVDVVLTRNNAMYVLHEMICCCCSKFILEHSFGCKIMIVPFDRGKSSLDFDSKHQL